MTTTLTSPAPGATVRPTMPYFVARAITVAAALAVDGEAYLGVVEAGGRFGFAFTDRAGTLRDKARAVWRGVAPPAQSRDVLAAYFTLRADLAAVRAAQAKGLCDDRY